jgi:nucleotide-binding universal stress UspA family protein
MKAFKKILVPVDFSACSNEAIQTAVDLAGRYEATICLLHVHDLGAHALPVGYQLPNPGQIEHVMASHGEQLERTKKGLEAAGARNLTTQLLRGVPASEIVAFAKDSAADLIVMGTHGRTGLEHVIVGSVAERVVRRASCPVLVVRSPA